MRAVDDGYYYGQWDMLKQNTTTPVVFTKGQNLALLVSRAVIGSLSFSFTLCYVLYVIAKSLKTFPWKKCFKCSSNNNLISSIQSECYIFSRPIGRIFFILLFCECIAITYVFFELAGVQESNRPICLYEGFVIQFFGLAKYGYNLVIAVWMLWILALRIKSKLYILEIVSHVVVWLFAIVGTVIPVAMNEFGWAGSYCWIRPTPRGTYLRFGTHYIPLWTIVFLVCCLYFVTLIIVFRRQWLSFRATARERKLKHISTSMKLYIKMMGFPLVFICLWIAPTIRRLMEAAGETAPFSLVFVHSITSPAMGFWYTVVLIISELVGVLWDKIRLKSSTVVPDRTMVDDDSYTKFTEDQEMLEEDY